MIAVNQSMVRSLKIAEWPKADQIAWTDALRPSQKLRRGGRASRLREVSQNDLARHYGRFLDYIDRTEGLAFDAVAGSYVDSTRVLGYLAELKLRVSSVTCYRSVHKLRRMTELLIATADLKWLREIEQELEWGQRPQSKFDRIVDSDRIVEAGLASILEAESNACLTPLQQARAFRNGLMVAFLALIPIRLKNFAGLEIGRSLISMGKHWYVVLEASQTKSSRADERPVPHVLEPYVSRYLDNYRGRFSPRTQALWVGTAGRRLSYDACQRAITETTRMALGVAISPHLFRACAASTAYLHAGNRPHLASGILQHTHETTTERHYNRARSVNYAHAFRVLVEGAKPDREEVLS